MARLRQPIILVGAARSGTTLLGRLLSQHPDVALWEEPNHIWRHHHAHRRHDVFTADDATPEVTAYIRRQFDEFLLRSGKERFAEKTPANCLRIPFVLEIFPDAQIIHILRDGRAVAVSAMRQWRHGLLIRREAHRAGSVANTSYPSSGETHGIVRGAAHASYAVRRFVLDTRRLAGGGWTLVEAPLYLPGLARTFARKVAHHRAFLWGPRFPGIQDVHRACSLLETCALQWMFSVQSVLVHTQHLAPHQYLEIRYERLIQDPVAVLRTVCAFAGLPWSPALGGAATHVVRPDCNSRWSSAISAEERALLEQWLAPLLGTLDYPA